MRRRQLFTLAGAAVVAAGWPSILRAQGALEKIRLAAIPSDALTPLYYGIKMGLFRQAGIDLEIIPAMSGTAATTAVITGTYEIANTSLIPAMVAHLRGIPIKIVCPQAVYTPENPFALLQVAADSPIKKGADLNGQTCGVGALNDLSSLGISAWVDENGGDSKTLKYVEMPLSAAGEAIAQHRIAAAMLLEPVLDASLSSGQTRTLGDAYRAIAPKFMFAAYVGRTDWAQQHGDLLRRFVKAADESATYTNAHPAETAPMMAEITKVPLPVMRRMKRVACATTMDVGLVQPYIDMAAKYKNIPQAFPAKDLFYIA